MMLHTISITAIFVLLLLQLYQVDDVNGDILDENVEDSFGVHRSLVSNLTQSCLICNVGAGDVQYGYNKSGSVDEFLSCMTESSQEPDGSATRVYTLDQLPKAFLHQYKKQLYSGNSRICIRQGRINRQNHQIVVPSNATVQLLPAAPGSSRRRRLYPSVGQDSLLVVRVTSTAGEDPGHTAGELQDFMFGTGPTSQKVSVASQYAACSQGKYNLVPYTGRNVVNGILDVQYQGQIAGGNIVGALQSSILGLVVNSLGVADLNHAADRIIFCLPNGSVISPSNESSWIGFSYLNDRRSFFQQKWCKSLSGGMHELGHQIGFKHSGIDSRAYADQECMMASSYFEVGGPQQCFNGNKNWLSGWYEDRKLTVNPFQTGAFVGNLYTFVDYANINLIPNSFVILNVGDLYIQLNSAKKFNARTVADWNRVTVIEMNATSPFSDRVATLGAGQAFAYGNFGGSGIDLAIQVCSISFGTADFAKISLYLLDGVQTSQCSTSLPPPPVAPPTVRPTRTPTVRPSKKPTPRPTVKPSIRPTTQPVTLTVRPTRVPTTGPPSVLPAPTLSPSVKPIEPTPPPVPTTKRPRRRVVPTNPPVPTPSTIPPTLPPTTPSPSSPPTILAPTLPPATPPPSSSPVTLAPVTLSPSSSPITATPSAFPVPTLSPSVKPTEPTPPIVPTTNRPRRRIVPTKPPVPVPPTLPPSSPPVTLPPSSPPATGVPSALPVPTPLPTLPPTAITLSPTVMPVVPTPPPVPTPIQPQAPRKTNKPRRRPPPVPSPAGVVPATSPSDLP